MAFTEAWDEDAPDGAVITISQLDNFQRKALFAIRERMEGDPANPLTGVVEAGTWPLGPILKAGVGRFAFGTEADVGLAQNQDGRGYFTTDGGVGHPKLFHISTAVDAEIAYLNRDGSRPLLGTLVVTKTVALAIVTQEGATIQTVQTAGAYNATNVYGLRILSNSKGAGVSVTNLYGVKVENISGATGTNYSVFTGDGKVRFGGQVLIQVSNTADPDLRVERSSAGIVMIELANTTGGLTQIQKNGSGELIMAVSSEMSVYGSGIGQYPFKVQAVGNVIVGLGDLVVGATDGFLYIPRIQGVPIGIPTVIGGYRAFCYDEINERLMVFDGGWKKVQFS